MAKSLKIRKLLSTLAERYGSRLRLWATDEIEEHGMGFKIDGILASFSVHTQEGKLSGDLVDIQIESDPPGEYLYSDVVSIERLLSLIEQISESPMNKWPRNPCG